jgi:hypothetical protein
MTERIASTSPIVLWRAHRPAQRRAASRAGAIVRRIHVVRRPPPDRTYVAMPQAIAAYRRAGRLSGADQRPSAVTLLV